LSARVHVALLRGINMGGRKRLPMKDLAHLFADAGAREVRTYIQSGNVVFRAAPGAAGALAAAVEKGMADRFGFTAPVVLRTAEELAAVVADNPFPAAGADPKALHVLFLAHPPDPERAAGLDPDRSPPDAFALGAREVYLYLPNGVARTRLSNDWFDRRLGTRSTGRNWRTVLTLLEMTRA
jgi:uncharacterized protein (DUF1697 family)